MRKIICVLLALSMLGMVGCGKEEKKAEPVKETVQTADLTIGNQSDQAYSLLLKNSVGQDITGVMIKRADQEEYPADMMKEEDVWAQGKVAQLFYTPEAPLSDGQTEKALNAVYELKLILADGSEAELSSFGMKDIDGQAELRCEDSVVFVVYQSKALNSQVSTKEQELAAKAQREVQEAEADAWSQETEQYQQPIPQEQGGYEQTVQQEAVGYEEPVVTESEPVPQAPEQSEESCLGEVEIVNP